MATLSVKAPSVNVYVNGRRSDIAQVLNVNMTAGGKSLPTASFVVEPVLRKSGRVRLLNRFLARFQQAEIEIEIVGKNKSVVHWGKVMANHAQLDQSGDSIVFESRMESHLFGTPLTGVYHYDPKKRAAYQYPVPAIFNPDYDGKSAKNMTTKFTRFPNGILSPDFLHPDSTRTPNSIRWNDRGEPKYWTLVDAVFYLCYCQNMYQQYVANPTLKELRDILPSDESLVRNHECRFGAYLPELLDDILEPFGYSWTVDFISRGHRKLRVFRRGTGASTPLFLQSPGSAVDMSSSNLEGCSLRADVSDRAFNKVDVYGDFPDWEMTVELIPAWANSYDEQAITDLQKNATAWATNPELERVWRDWVLNEAGDYIGVRRGVSQAYDFGRHIKGAEWFPRRRKLLPCLTLNNDGSPKGHSGGVYVEWYDKIGGGVWRSVDELSSEGRTIRILDRECGIRFDGLEIPSQIRRQGQYAKVRVTAVIKLDTRLGCTGHARFPLLEDTKCEVLDVAGRFKYAVRVNNSRFSRTRLPASSADDTKAMLELAKNIVNTWNAATIDGPATITGIDYDFIGAIGCVVPRIQGRNVSFNTSLDRDRFPSVMSISIRPQDQVTELSLDTAQGESSYFERHTDLTSGKRRRRR